MGSFHREVFAPTMWVDLPVAIADSPENPVKLAALVVEQEDGHPGAWHHLLRQLGIDCVPDVIKTLYYERKNGVDPNGAHPFLMYCT